ncbi:MAG: hypothetical protein LBR77_08730 [Lachnospiraceae bacterium]|jgi:hypothetical protein|nr:hypothetical protein [Lachnospiraceae bacterium]
MRVFKDVSDTDRGDLAREIFEDMGDTDGDDLAHEVGGDGDHRWRDRPFGGIRADDLAKNVFDDDYPAIEESFRRWVVSGGKSESTARVYVSTLRRSIVKTLKLGHELQPSLFAYATIEDLVQVLPTILVSPEFAGLTKSKRHLFTAALSAYGQFLQAGIPFAEAADRKRGLATPEPIVNTDIDPETEDAIRTVPWEPDGCNFTLFVSQKTAKAIRTVLLERYKNGFRLGSPLETRRLRQFAGELLEEEITLTDEELEPFVRSCGWVFEGKVFVIGEDTRSKIEDLVVGCLAEGANAIFFEEFYAKHGDWLLDAGVASEKLLADILKEIFPELLFSRLYFGKARGHVFDVIEKEIRRVWGDVVLATYDELAERLLYVPRERIRLTLAQKSGTFIWNAIGEYTHVGRINISGGEVAAIRQAVEEGMGTKGYVSMADIPLEGFRENNFELSQTGVYGAVFCICLSDAYERHDKIITRKGEPLDAGYLMNEHCRSLDRCTLKDLFDYEREVTGECHGAVAVQAGYDVMVRTGEDAFVAERFLDFDRGAIDHAIEQFMHGREYLPLRGVTTFVSFPHCGQAWNLFLLESYCRRFSENFRFESQTLNAVNASHAGAILRKHSRLSYHEIMADAVAKAGVAPEEEAVLEFLAQEGYLARRRYGKVADLLVQAKSALG